jgi:serine/threonine protein kinase
MTGQSSERAFPERLGRYQLITPIAAGGMGTVYLARVTAIGGFSRQVAIKVLDAKVASSEPGAAPDELLDEARVASSIRHPAVVPVLDVGSSPAGPYLVMEYVEGDSLANLLQAMRSEGALLPPEIGLRILSDALQGLHAAHEARDDRGRPLNIVHRDFSPQNILVGVDGAARLTDFGIARSVDRAEYTRTGIVRGKIGYMSPEQAQGLPLDRVSDVWSAGVVAWETFAGKRLFAGDPVPTLLRILNRPPPALSAVLPQAPPELSDVIASALQQDPSSRIATAGELRRRLLGACVGWVEPASSEEVADFVTSVAARTLGELRERAKRAEARPRPPEPGTGSRRRTPAARFLIWGAAGGAALGATLVFTLAKAPAPAAPSPTSSVPPTADAPSPLGGPLASSTTAAAEPSAAAPAGPVAPSRRPARSIPSVKAAPVTQKPNDLAPNPY